MKIDLLEQRSDGSNYIVSITGADKFTVDHGKNGNLKKSFYHIESWGEEGYTEKRYATDKTAIVSIENG